MRKLRIFYFFSFLKTAQQKLLESSFSKYYINKLENKLLGILLILALSVVTEIRGDPFLKAGRTVSFDTVPRQLYKYYPDYYGYFKIENNWYCIYVDIGSYDTLTVRLWFDGPDTVIRTLVIPINLLGNNSYQPLPTVDASGSLIINIWNFSSFPYPIGIKVFKNDSTSIYFSSMETTGTYILRLPRRLRSFFNPTSRIPISEGDSILIQFWQGVWDLGDTVIVKVINWPDQNFFVQIPRETLYIRKHSLDRKITRVGDAIIINDDSTNLFYELPFWSPWFRGSLNIRILDLKVKVVRNFVRVKVKVHNDIKSDWGARGWLKWWIGEIRDSIRIISLWPGRDTIFEFNTPPLTPGRHSLVVVSYSPSDKNPNDDTSICEINIPEQGWRRLPDLPSTTPDGKSLINRGGIIFSAGNRIGYVVSKNRKDWLGFGTLERRIVLDSRVLMKDPSEKVFRSGDAIYINNKVYIARGNKSTHLVVRDLTTGADRLILIPQQLIGKQASLTYVKVNGKEYLALLPMGIKGNDYLGLLDPETGIWVTYHLNFEKDKISTGASICPTGNENEIAILDGANRRILKFDFLGDSITNETQIPKQIWGGKKGKDRSEIVYNEADGKFYIIGGGIKGYYIWNYDPATELWNPLPQPSFERRKTLPGSSLVLIEEEFNKYLYLVATPGKTNELWGYFLLQNLSLEGKKEITEREKSPLVKISRIYKRDQSTNIYLPRSAVVTFYNILGEKILSINSNKSWLRVPQNLPSGIYFGVVTEGIKDKENKLVRKSNIYKIVVVK